LGLLYLLHKQH